MPFLERHPLFFLYKSILLFSHLIFYLLCFHLLQVRLVYLIPVTVV